MQTPPDPEPRHDLTTRAAHVVTRIVAGAAGLTLVVGFFLPWVKAGDLAVLSGFALLVSSGTMTDVLAGPSRALLFAIPAAGAAIVACSFISAKAAARASLSCGLAILIFGFYAVARAFLASTGPGMWLVVLAALIATGVGLVATTRDNR